MEKIYKLSLKLDWLNEVWYDFKLISEPVKSVTDLNIVLYSFRLPKDKLDVIDSTLNDGITSVYSTSYVWFENIDDLEMYKEKLKEETMNSMRNKLQQYRDKIVTIDKLIHHADNNDAKFADRTDC